MSESLTVQALHSFKGSHNDELCFKKGDIITVTQNEEGGWWEGTLGDKTGWFPSNYVKECKETVNNPLSPISQQRQYRAVVLKDLIDSERAHVIELQGLVKNFLKPLEKNALLTVDEFRQLTGNINEVLETHQQLLQLLEECEAQPSNEQRVGRLFLNMAPRIKGVHQMYCALHPRAVCILDLHKDELATYMESCGAATPGLLVLTTGLSKPFRRLDKYSGMLQELERHVEISHPDRGDTQRSVAVYKEIATTCAATRRQKELELQVLTGPVRGWEGQSLSQLGDILHMGSVAVGPQHQDRYLVLFPNTLLVLSVSKRMSAFIYEGKLPLTGITVMKLEDTETYKNAFEISGPLIEKIVAVCQSKDEASFWVDLLRQHTKSKHKTPPPTTPVDSVPQPPPHHKTWPFFTTVPSLGYFCIPSIKYKASYPPVHYPPASPYSVLTKSFCRLVKEKVITQRLLKKLLYSEYIYEEKIDTSCVKLRHHRTEIHITTGGSDESSSEDDDDRPLCRQDAVAHSDSSDEGSTDTNPFGFIRYYNPRSREESAKSPDSNESFIDHGETQIRIETTAEMCDEFIAPTREKLKLGVINQISEGSGSSFECPHRPYMACEDLFNMDQNTEMNTLGSRQYIPKMRQSLPTKFVANRFNKSSLTMVYIPPWQSNSESNLARRSDSESSDTGTHSSCLDIEVKPVVLPDAVVADILYNQVSLESEKTVIKPPTMFNDSPTVSLRLSNVEFKKHSIDSDKPKRRSKSVSREVSDEVSEVKTERKSSHVDVTLREKPAPREIKCRSSLHDKNSGALRKCVSYHYLQLANPKNSDYTPFCQCYTQPCCSRRSSDSGMAGSCTLHSPDLAGNDTESLLYSNRQNLSLTNLPDTCQTMGDLRTISYSEIEARDFEAQCRCTSPFDSTPRTSCQASTSDNVMVGARDSSVSLTSSSSDMSPFPMPWESENQIHQKIMSVRQQQDRLRGHQPQSRSCDELKRPEQSGAPELFRSGLYAHWWMKARIPTAVIRGIVEESNSSAADAVADEPRQPKPSKPAKPGERS